MKMWQAGKGGIVSLSPPKFLQVWGVQGEFSLCWLGRGGIPKNPPGIPKTPLRDFPPQCLREGDPSTPPQKTSLGEELLDLAWVPISHFPPDSQICVDAAARDEFHVVQVTSGDSRNRSPVTLATLKPSVQPTVRLWGALGGLPNSGGAARSCLHSRSPGRAVRDGAEPPRDFSPASRLRARLYQRAARVP